jgi:hypothetical protein
VSQCQVREPADRDFAIDRRTRQALHWPFSQSGWRICATFRSQYALQGERVFRVLDKKSGRTDWLNTKKTFSQTRIQNLLSSLQSASVKDWDPRPPSCIKPVTPWCETSTKEEILLACLTPLVHWMVKWFITCATPIGWVNGWTGDLKMLGTWREIGNSGMRFHGG